MTTDGTIQTPRTWVLIAVNVASWCVYIGTLAFRADPFGVIFLALSLAVILGVTTSAQYILHLVLRRRSVHRIARIALFFTPSLALVVVALAVRHHAPLNKRQDQPSPSGSYLLAVPTERNTATPGHEGRLVWKVTIRNSNGELEYKDGDSTFVGHLNVYWVWGEKDRVWLYNSDDSNVYFWEKIDGRWVKKRWGYGRTREITNDLSPPDALYPDYVWQTHQSY